MEEYKSKLSDDCIKPEVNIIEVENEGVLCSSTLTGNTNVFISGF